MQAAWGAAGFGLEQIIGRVWKLGRLHPAVQIQAFVDIDGRITKKRQTGLTVRL